jgi:hypothetical protein
MGTADATTSLLPEKWEKFGGKLGYLGNLYVE